MQDFVNNRLWHNTARKQKSRPRSGNEFGPPVPDHGKLHTTERRCSQLISLFFHCV